jgi:diguanylate cyclase (GGDEF)-like protein/PAS domain S-box-containing protein
MSDFVIPSSDDLSKLVAVDRRLTLSFGVLILALMLIGLASAVLYLNGVMKREEQQLSTLLTRTLAVSVSRVSFSGRYHAQLLLEDIQADHPGIRYLLITDTEGMVLASSDASLIDTRLQGASAEQARQVMAQGASGQSLQRLIDGEPVLVVTLPYRGDFDHRVLGVVQVGISQASRMAALRQGIIYVMAMVALLLLVGIFMVHRISRAFGMPIRRLADDMAATLQALPDLLFELDAEGRYVQVLAHDKKLLVDTPERLIGSTTRQVLPPEVAAVVEDAMGEASAQGVSNGRQYALELSGTTHWFELSIARKQMRQGEPSNFIVLSRNITDRKRTEENLYLFANAFKHSGEAILITDRDNRIVAANPALERHTGYSYAELTGRNPRLFASGHVSRDTYREMWSALRETGYWQGELWDRNKDGGIYPQWASISAIRNKAGEVTHYIASYTDISERKAAEERIEFIAHHDVLTGLFNRYSLEERLEQALLAAQRNGERLAVMFIDMDRFKNINDTLGHHTGDHLLEEIGRRLELQVRRSDIVARLGGDEFIVVLSEVESDIAVGGVATQIVSRLAEVYRVDDQILHITASIGISLYPNDGVDVETLMKHADAAMYCAKDKGRNNFQFYTPAMNRAIEERMMLENEMRLALERQEFELHYQPICDCRGEWRGLEALVRWRHPERGVISPALFIPIAEESRLIVPLGDWVIEEACRQSAAWRREIGFNLPISVNLSVYQLYSAGLIERVNRLLTEYRIETGGLKCEITESAAMENPEQAIQHLHRLREAGIELAIDDFGTGYSSLAYLKRLPIQTLKLDRTFVGDIDRDENDAAISAATVALAHNLGLSVVAEGVETEAQREFLVAHGCDCLQGYLFSHPLRSEEVLTHFAKRKRVSEGHA